MLHRLLSLRTFVAGGAAAALCLAALTASQLAPLPDELGDVLASATPALTARGGEWLATRYNGEWNTHRRLAPAATPPLLQAAMLAAEDQRFYSHSGADWLARAHAAWQNVRAGRVVRGASTISEQVVRMLHPRPRTAWSRWLEGFDAWRLERRFGKPAVLAFYLDQVPYGAHRRGVQQAASFYFGRDVSSASLPELLALAVLPRAPSRLFAESFQPFAEKAHEHNRELLARSHRRHPRRTGQLHESEGLAARMRWLARRLHDNGEPGAAELASLITPLDVVREPHEPNARHFVVAVRERLAATAPERAPAIRRTTLDVAVQSLARRALNVRLEQLADANAGDAAALVLEHKSGAVRAWTTVQRGIGDSAIDAARVPRLAGSTLKPLLYALAIERGASTGSRLSDAPLQQAVGSGLHTYRNFGRAHFGEVTLREALGSSLNLPAVRTLGQVGSTDFLESLRSLGLRSLTAHPAHYGEGLALGNAEVSLLALARAYAAIARGGRTVELRLLEDTATREGQRAMRAETASALRDVLADPYARSLEFGRGGNLHMPNGVAVKTGTSSGHRDAWAVAFDRQYLVAVWMGNLDGSAMRGVTGAAGPALAVRTVFAGLPRSALRRRHSTLPPAGHSPSPASLIAQPVSDARPRPRITLPTPGLRIALDPRIPDALEAFGFEVSDVPADAKVEWWLNGERVAVSTQSRFVWRVREGRHELHVRVLAAGQAAYATRPVRFEVR